MEDESFQLGQITQSMQPFVDQQLLLNSNLDESSYEQIYNLDREFSQLFHEKQRNHKANTEAENSVVDCAAGPQKDIQTA